MKKTRRLLTTVCVLMAVLQVFATDYKYLTFQKKDGDESSLLLSGLKLSFNSGVLTASRVGQKPLIKLSILLKCILAKPLRLFSLYKTPVQPFHLKVLHYRLMLPQVPFHVFSMLVENLLCPRPSLPTELRLMLIFCYQEFM